jgi:inhibitor of KinA sporulation pathway (predicted exonuclease)
MKTPSSKQVGLVAAAEMLGISIAKYSQHRALDDSMLEAECFKRIYNKKLFNLMIHDVIIRSTKSLIISHIL